MNKTKSFLLILKIINIILCLLFIIIRIDYLKKDIFMFIYLLINLLSYFFIILLDYYNHSEKPDYIEYKSEYNFPSQRL
jgi:hypothetical protein